MAKKESQDGKSKKGLPRLMELAIYFIIQEIVGAYPDFSTLDVPKVLYLIQKRILNMLH